MKYCTVLFLFIVLCANAHTKTPPVDRTNETRSIIALEALALGYDSAHAVRDFNLLLEVLKIRAIYFVTNETQTSHYLYPQRVILINPLNKKSTLLEKILGEFVHGVQFRFRPIHYSKRALGSFLRTGLRLAVHYRAYYRQADSICHERGYRTVSKEMVVWMAYGPEYSNPKSFERDHGVIEPGLHMLFKWMNGLPVPPTKKVIKQFLRSLLREGSFFSEKSIQ